MENKENKENNVSAKSRGIALVLSVLPFVSLHSLYTGRIKHWLLIFVTSPLGIGIVLQYIDLFLILTGNFKDNEGKKLKNW